MRGPRPCRAAYPNDARGGGDRGRPLPAAPPGREGGGGEIWAKAGLPSADRNDKATLPLTGPVRAARSSAEDLIPRAPKLQYAERPRARPARGGRPPAGVRGRGLFSPAWGVREASPRSGTDSDLEAFSHYPADGSVAAPPGRTAAEANYPNQRFLSY